MNSPSFYDPVANPENAIARRNQVLGRNARAEAKSPKQQHDAAAATGVGLKITPARQGCAAATMAPYFCDYVSHLILNNPAYGADTEARERKLFRGGLTITTTLDSRLQAAAQAQVERHRRSQPGQVGRVAGHRPARHRQDPGDGAEHGVPSRSPASSIPS